VGPLIVYTLVFIVTAALVPVINVAWLFNFTLGSLAVIGVCTALLTGGVFGLGALFPPIYTQALMAGQGLAGLVTSLASIFTLLAVKPDNTCGEDDSNDDANNSCDPYSKVDWAAFSYFVVAVIMLLMCIVCYVILDKMPITEYYRNRAKSNPTSVDIETNDAVQPLLDIVTDDDYNPAVSSERLRHVIGVVRGPATAVFLVFLVTLALFPTITGSIKSSKNCDDPDNRFQNDLFIPVSFLLFNGGDLLGRSLAGKVDTTNEKGTRRILVIASACRFVFFPLFLLCNVSSTILPVVFSNDFYPIAFMIVFAVSNGLTSTVCMMVGPSMVPANEQEMAGNVMVFSLSSGLFMGSVVSFACLKIGTGKW